METQGKPVFGSQVDNPTESEREAKQDEHLTSIH